MIYWELFLVFSKIGIVNFGGGYAMLALIQDEVVSKHGWLTSQQFTDIVAVSQMTPGPIGINAATYVGYRAVIEQGGGDFMGIIGAMIATLSVVWLPFILMIALSYFLLKNKDKAWMKGIFSSLRPTVIGLIASAAILLLTEENFGNPSEMPIQFVLSLLFFISAFIAVYKYKYSPLVVLIVSACLGIFIYPWIG